MMAGSLDLGLVYPGMIVGGEIWVVAMVVGMVVQKEGTLNMGVMRSSVVCKERGRCYKKKLTCPAKCYTSYSRSGKGFGGGGGGGGCTLDCKKCVAYC
ncbi:hypothetical protein OIU76_029131 [Salix suchowensis]|nr:hypothetical protein OIU76_029131 [Salix suchowensis]